MSNLSVQWCALKTRGSSCRSCGARTRERKSSRNLSLPQPTHNRTAAHNQTPQQQQQQQGSNNKKTLCSGSLRHQHGVYTPDSVYAASVRSQLRAANFVCSNCSCRADTHACVPVCPPGSASRQPQISTARRRKENNSLRAASAKKPETRRHTHKPHVRCNFCAKARAGFASVCTVLEFVLSSLAN